MPSSHIVSPDLATASGSYKERARDWVLTANYSSVNKADLPINPYGDTQYTPLWQNLWGGYTRYDSSSGQTTVIYGPMYAYTGSTIRNSFLAGCYFAAGLDSFISSLKNAAMVAALANSADQKVNLAVALAEASKTSNLILSTAYRIDRAYRALKRGNFQEVARQLNISPKKVHKTWLEYKYGWMPLLMDVKGSAEFLAQQNVGRLTRFTAQGYKAGEKSFSRVIPDVAYGGETWNFTETISCSAKARAKLWLELTSPTLSAAQQVGITNPLLVAWELVPYSFVFDWFIQVGDYLKGRCALDGVAVRKAMISVYDLEYYQRSAPNSSRTVGTITHFTASRSCGGTRRNYSRASWLVDPSSLYPPSNVDSLGFQKLITSLALLRAQRR